MSNSIIVSFKDIVHQVKLSCQFPDVLESILSRQIIKQAIEKSDVEVTPEEIQAAADEMRLVMGLQSAELTWSWLETHHLDLENFEEIAYNSLITQKLAHKVFGNEVEPFFTQHQLDYAEAVFYEVILEDSDLAMELFYALKEGEISFPEVAAQYIRDTEQRRKGGYRGRLGRTALKPEISAAVFSASPNQVIKPILTSQGAHLILVEELITPVLDDNLRQEILESLFSEWLSSEVKKLEVKIEEKELRVSNNG